MKSTWNCMNQHSGVSACLVQCTELGTYMHRNNLNRLRYVSRRKKRTMDPHRGRIFVVISPQCSTQNGRIS